MVGSLAERDDTMNRCDHHDLCNPRAQRRLRRTASALIRFRDEWPKSWRLLTAGHTPRARDRPPNWWREQDVAISPARLPCEHMRNHARRFNRGAVEDIGKSSIDGVKDHDMDKYLRAIQKWGNRNPDDSPKHALRSRATEPGAILIV